jgi:cation diffusion facilitator CzcD-associated flavoprotein CzcO
LLFQRTARWVIAKPDRAIGRFEQTLYRFLPLLQFAYRVMLYWLLEVRVFGFVVNPKIMEMPQREALRFLEEQVPDPVLRAKLTPNFMFGCKRVLMSNEYFPALNRKNVDVVTTGIREVTRDGIITNDGTHRKLDALILGTGFAASEAAAPFPIAGIGGVDLNEHWTDGAEAYLGTAIAGYPNLFTLVGPNTGLGHTSLIFIIEAQAEHVMQALHALRRNGAKWIDVRQDVQDRFNKRLHERMAASVWASGCASWYQTKSGKNTTLWPGFTFTFRNLTARALDTAHYRFGVAGEAGAAISEAPRAMAASNDAAPALRGGA